MLAVLAASQLRAQRGADGQRMPGGLSPPSAIIQADYEDNVKDAHQLTLLAKSIEKDFGNGGGNAVSPALLKKLDDVDKITARIRGRFRH